MWPFRAIREWFTKPRPRSYVGGYASSSKVVAKMPLIGPPGPASISPPEGSDDTVEFLWEHTICTCDVGQQAIAHKLGCAKWMGVLAYTRARSSST